MMYAKISCIVQTDPSGKKDFSYQVIARHALKSENNKVWSLIGFSGCVGLSSKYLSK